MLKYFMTLLLGLQFLLFFNGLTAVSVSQNAEELGGQFEGDIILPSSDVQSSGIVTASSSWPDGRVFYKMDDKFTLKERKRILNAMREITVRACVEFKEDLGKEFGFVQIVRGPPGTGCRAHVGYSGFSQLLFLEENSCINHGTIIHEHLHTLGFYHEHSRADRDDYIDIDEGNIAVADRQNFKKLNLSHVTDYGIPYDYSSIMHYRENAFAVNPEMPTIITKDSSVDIGNREYLSVLDVERIQRRYSTKNFKCQCSAPTTCTKERIFTETDVKKKLSLALVLQKNSTVAQKTSFINHESKLRGYAEPGWFEANIPFMEVPHKEIEEVYYYRWSSLKRHLRYTVPAAGYIVTEFIRRVGYALKFDTINAAAGHHIMEARWLRNKQYVHDYINFWAREGGDPNKYSEWIAHSAYNSFLLDADKEFIKSQQQGLVQNFHGWDHNFDQNWGLYWISPEWDAMQESCSSLQTDNPWGGGVGYRPSFNAEMYGNARAIGKIAALNNDQQTAQDFEARAEALKSAIVSRLWDPQRRFFYHAFRDKNVNYKLLDSREEIGFYPWAWLIVPNSTEYAEAWEQLWDPQGFNTTWGPTTCEVRSPWYNNHKAWNGNSWPYSTSLTLASLAAQVRDYANSAKVTVPEYFQLLEQFTRMQYKNNKPYVAGCHSPVGKNWVCDDDNHPHYAHSTYNDNVLSGLLGVSPQADDTFVIDPLVPKHWRFFAIENLPYHGHEITVLYDADGSHYESGHSGLQIFVNGRFVKSQPNLSKMRVAVPPAVLPGKPVQRLENYAANVNSENWPAPRVSFNAEFSNQWHPLDGRIIYDYNVLNRWSNFGSPNEKDWFEVDFGPGRSKTISQVKLYVYSDVVTGEGGVDCPQSMLVEIFDGTNWVPAENQAATPSVCSPNDVNTIDFTAVKTQQIRVVFTRNVKQNYFVGVTEIEIWAPWPQAPVSSYEAEDGFISNSKVNAGALASGGSYVGEIDRNDSSVEFTGVWMDRPGIYSIKVFYANALDNEATHRLLANNQDEVLVTYFPTTSGWGHFESSVTVQVPLLRGNNVLIFRKGVGNAELDRIQVLT